MVRMRHLIDWWRKPHQDSKLTAGEAVAFIMCALAGIAILIGAAVAAGWTI